MQRNKVDFPLPESPMTTKISPLFTSKLASKTPIVAPVSCSSSALLLPARRSASACSARRPKTFETCSTRMIASLSSIAPSQVIVTPLARAYHVCALPVNQHVACCTRRDPSVAAFEHLLPPLLCALHLIERVDVQPPDVVVRVIKVGGEACDQLIGGIASRFEKACRQARVFGEEAHGVAHADLHRDPQELPAVKDARNANVDGQIDPLLPDAGKPTNDRLWIEADLGDHVAGKRLFVCQHPAQGHIVDERMALRIGGDADLCEVVPHIGQGTEQIKSAGKGAGGLLHISANHKDLAQAQSVQALHDLLEMGRIDDESGGDMRDDLQAL